MTIQWRIPPSVLEHLAHLPANRPVAMLLRHSVRDALPPGEAGNALPITPSGKALAEQLGKALGSRLASIHSSPLRRCVQTSESLRRGAGADLGVLPDRLLGDPGVFVLDGDRAWHNWQERGHESVMEHLVSRNEALVGMARPDEAACFLVQHMLSVSRGLPGVHVFVTHDSLITATAARLLGAHLGPQDWPWFLEAAFFWQGEEGVHASYRNLAATRPNPLCPLDEPTVIEFARREVASTIGFDSGARFFLAGGAFKTLLTGRPPRDLDIWAASAGDRARVISSLVERGASSVCAAPFADVFAIGDRIVEVPHKVVPQTLEGRLARFDIGLSAVGVEHQACGTWRAVIHPLALESVRRRAVLLLRPLVNWKYAIATLERARRYADELGFAVPTDEENVVWEVFAEQSAEMRRGMVERYERTGRGEYGVPAELARRIG